ncbi:MAG: hypothetical protein M9900_15285 [Flavobacteriales bacterium]|nr:hypothetical protein [Flavobacteriales bacterium]
MALLKRLSNSGVTLFVLALLFALPVLIPPRFITMDSGAHAYNVHIIRSLLLDPDGTIAHYFRFNPVPVPNWSGHVLVALLTSFVNAAVAEKLAWLVYLVFTPFGIRALLVRHGAPAYLALLFLPFLQQLLMYLGFMNYCIGIALFPWALIAIGQVIEQPSGRRAILLGFLFLALFFSHLFPFLVAVITLGVALALDLLRSIRKHDGSLPRKFRGTVLPVALAMVPSSVLLVNYWSHPVEAAAPVRLSGAEQVAYILKWPVLHAYGGGPESWLAPLLGLGGVLFVAVGVWQAIRKGLPEGVGAVPGALLFTAIILLVAFVVLPNDDGAAGYISPRLFWFALFLLLLWAAIILGPVEERGVRLTAHILTLSLLAAGIGLLDYRMKAAKDAYGNYARIMEARDVMPRTGHMVPAFFNGQQNWMGGHLSNYYAEQGEVILWGNYEATKGYFPIRWREENKPNIYLGKVDMYHSCLCWENNLESTDVIPADLVLLIIADTASDCQVETVAIMKEQGYTLSFGNDRVLLYAYPQRLKASATKAHHTTSFAKSAFK